MCTEETFFIHIFHCGLVQKAVTTSLQLITSRIWKWMKISICPKKYYISTRMRWSAYLRINLWNYSGQPTKAYGCRKTLHGFFLGNFLQIKKEKEKEKVNKREEIYFRNLKNAIMCIIHQSNISFHLFFTD